MEINRYYEIQQAMALKDKQKPKFQGFLRVTHIEPRIKIIDDNGTQRMSVLKIRDIQIKEMMRKELDAKIKQYKKDNKKYTTLGEIFLTGNK